MQSSASAESTSKLQILVVEDNLTNQKLLIQILDRLGYAADCAKDGLEALEALRRHTYPIVLMDVQMPRMDGLAATRQIRREFPLERQPQIIGVTGYALSQDQKECIAAGMDLCLIKPVRLETLAQTLNQCVLRSRDRQMGHGLADRTQDVLDPERLSEILAVAGDDAARFLVSSVNDYFETAPALLNSLRAAIAQNQPAILYSSAHTLKSISAFFGATRMAQLCQMLEDLRDQAIPPNTEQLVQQLEQQYEQVKRALEFECERALNQG